MITTMLGRPAGVSAGRGRQGRGHETRGGEASPQEVREIRQARDGPGRGGGLEAARMSVAAGRQPRVGEEQQPGVHQNRKYRWAMGSSTAGAGSTSSPSIITVKVSGSTSIRGSASLSGMARLPSPRVSRTGTSRRRTSSRSASPSSITAGGGEGSDAGG